MRSIKYFNKIRNDDDLLARYIVTKKVKKLKKLKFVFDYNIRAYLYTKLSKIYLNNIPLYNILFEVLEDGYQKYNTSGGCTYLSSSIILAMNQDDMLVNGNLAPESAKGYDHYWVEFYYFDEWYVLDGVLMNVYNKEQYYLVFNPIVNFKKSNEELMKDDFVRKHAELLKNPEWSCDDKLFFYYRGEKIEECKKRLYENIETDENGHIISYNMGIEKSHSR
jgi:hypothetical protein